MIRGGVKKCGPLKIRRQSYPGGGKGSRKGGEQTGVKGKNGKNTRDVVENRLDWKCIDNH